MQKDVANTIQGLHISMMCANPGLAARKRHGIGMNLPKSRHAL